MALTILDLEGEVEEWVERVGRVTHERGRHRCMLYSISTGRTVVHSGGGIGAGVQCAAVLF